MLKSLKIENFRCFPTFELQQLGQVNLLVGTNNSGKTSILEAVQLLSSQTPLEPLWESMKSRGEYIESEDGNRPELDIRHLFYGHNIDVGSQLSISGYDRDRKQELVLAIERDESRQGSLFETTQEVDDYPNLILLINRETYPQGHMIPTGNIILPLSFQEGLSLDYVKRLRWNSKELSARTQFVKSSSLSPEEMIELFEKIVLMPEENLVTEALKTIDPRIERLASVSFKKYKYVSSRIGFVVKLANENRRIPIGSMGDGIWRMLGLTLAIINARNGVLLVDEIDTGLHFSAMSDMWKLIWKTAKKLNVQVFATTHNSDCWTSLAEISSTESPSEEGITIQRIEPGRSNSVVFTERQVVIAAERGIEVR